MLILALDTTTRAGSVAVTRDSRVLALIDGDAARTHGERLPGEIERVLAKAGVARQDLELLVVARGPGAFTGLRIGIAAVQGLAMVLNIPVVGVSALDAMASAAWSALLRSSEQDLLVWMDAQRGEVFSAHYRASGSDDPPWRESGEAVVLPVEDILASLGGSLDRGAAFVGDGAVRYRSAIEARRGRVIAPSPPLAPSLALIGQRLAHLGLAGPPHSLQPLYVRRPDAELERLRRSDA